MLGVKNGTNNAVGFSVHGKWLPVGIVGIPPWFLAGRPVRSSARRGGGVVSKP